MKILVTGGNWGDEERTAELYQFLLEPAKGLRLKSEVFGVRYPQEALAALAGAGIKYRGWLPNYEVPSVFARFRVTVHIPRRPYVKALPGIPTIRPFEALACGIPLISAPWEDSEGLFTPGADFLIARDGDEMKRHLKMLLKDEEEEEVVVYPGEGEEGVLRALERARDAQLIVKASGVGVFDELLEAAVLDLQGAGRQVIFWDVDAPATLDRLRQNPADPFHALIPRYDLILTYGGGAPVVDAYEAFGARVCVPIYNALDPETHHPVPPDGRFAGDLGFLGNRLPDREARVEEFFLQAAAALPEKTFLLGGSGWGDKPLPKNVRYLGHVYTRDHNAFNATPRAVLNINRESMARDGFSPPTWVFEAAGASACLITDAWEGIEAFLEPGREVLVARSGEEVAAHLGSLTPERARAVGGAGRRRILAEHTYLHRAAQLETLFDENRAIRTEVA